MGGKDLSPDERSAKVDKMQAHWEQMEDGKPKEKLGGILDDARLQSAMLHMIEAGRAAGRDHTTTEATQIRQHVTTEMEQTRDLMTTQLAEPKQCVTKITDVMTGRAPTLRKCGTTKA